MTIMRKSVTAYFEQHSITFIISCNSARKFNKSTNNTTPPPQKKKKKTHPKTKKEESKQAKKYKQNPYTKQWQNYRKLRSAMELTAGFKMELTLTVQTY